MTEKTEQTNFIIDSELLPLFEKAENGCFDSIVDLAIAFGEGNGAKIDYELAGKYEAMMLGQTDDNELKLRLLWNKAVYHRDRADYDLMEEQFKIVVAFMLKNIPVSEWNFSLFEMIEELSQETEI